MTGLVLELQADAMNSQVGVSELLRKALSVSRKLGVADIQEWIGHELHGYDESDPPAYRHFVAQLKVHNPYHGLQPFFVEDEQLARDLSSVRVFQSIGEIEELARGAEKGNRIMFPFSPGQENALMHAMEVPLRPCRIIGPNQLHGVFEAVRNRVLEWALELESRSVIGEGMTFTKQEKVAASQVTNNYNTHIGTMTHSQLQQNSAHAQQSLSPGASLDVILQALDLLRAIPASDVATEVAGEFKAELESIEAQVRSPKPKVTILSEGFKSIRSILERTVGSVIAAKALPAVVKALEYLHQHL